MNELNNLEIIEKQNDVTYEVPQVNFPAYEEYKDLKTTQVAQLVKDRIAACIQENTKENEP